MYDLIQELKDAAGILEREGVSFALCGGLAMGLYGDPRATVDIGLVIVPEDLSKAVEALKGAGFEFVADPMILTREKIEIHRVIKLGRGETEVLMLDLCVPDPSAYPDVWKDWERIEVAGESIPVLSRKGLIAMKQGRSSNQDLADIQKLKE